MALRVGIIGTGWGLKVQVPQFRAAGLEISAIYSRSPDRAQAIAEEHAIPHAFSSIDDLVNSEAVDLVSVVGPTHERHSAVLKACEAGKHVLSEKPMALNAQQAQEMQDKARAMAGNNRLYLLDFELRCVPAVRRMRELVGCGRIGAVQFIGVSVLANFGFLADGATHSHWAMRECGGGVFSAVGTHMVDVCRFVLSDEVARVSATEAPLVATLPDAEGVARPVTADGYVAAQLRMRDTGTPVQITISGRTPGVGKMYENRMVIAGSAGTLVFNFLNCELKAWLEGAPDGGEPTEAMPPAEGDAWSAVGTPRLGAAIRRAVTGAGAGEELPQELLATFGDGLEVQRVTDAVHESAAQGGAWVELSV